MKLDEEANSSVFIEPFRSIQLYLLPLSTILTLKKECQTFIINIYVPRPLTCYVKLSVLTLSIIKIITDQPLETSATVKYMNILSRLS